MQVKIGTVLYDTETATLIKHTTHSYFGDPEGYEEKIYCTPSGCYFLWGKGGENSPYPTERIIRIAKSKIDAYLK